MRQSAPERHRGRCPGGSRESRGGAVSREIAAARPVRSGLGASIASQGGRMEAELPGFERAVDDALRTFDRLSPCQAYPPFAELIHQGEPARAVYVIVQGLVKLECGQGDG